MLDAEGPSADRARLLAAHARSALNSDRDDEAMVTAERAVAEARQLGVADAEADALTTLAVLEVDDADRAAELLGASVARARESGDLLTELRGTHNLAGNRYYAGELEEARLICEAGIVRAQVHRRALDGLRRRHAHLPRADPLRHRRSDAGPAAGRLGTRVGHLDLVGGRPVCGGRPRGHRRDRARPVDQGRLAAGPDDGAGVGWLHHRRADLGRPSSGRRSTSPCRSSRSWTVPGTTTSSVGSGSPRLGLAALADRAEQTRLTGGDLSADLALGATLLERTVETARRGRPRGGKLGPEGRGWMARARAEYGRLIGQDEPALWREAIEEFSFEHRGKGYRYEVARSRWRLAGALQGAGDPAAARTEAAAALAEATEMGARPLSEAIVAFGRRARLDLPGTRQPIGVLTDREDEVLRLVAKGLTNRQVGERLFISAKTVSVHMSNVLAKLGVSGRAEAVSVAHQRGLIGAD